MLLETLVEKILFTCKTYINQKHTLLSMKLFKCQSLSPTKVFFKNKNNPKQINSNPFVALYPPTQHNKQQIVRGLPLDNQLHDVLGGHGRRIVLRIVSLGSLEADPGEDSSHFLHVIL